MDFMSIDPLDFMLIGRMEDRIKEFRSLPPLN